MRWSKIEMMRDHVRAIHRAVTGEDPPDHAPRAHGGAGAAGATGASGQSSASGGGPEPTADAVLARFVELESMAHAIEAIAERVPRFSFVPPFDLIGTERELICELGVPGVERADVDVELRGHTLTISGARSTGAALDGKIYLHAELPRGPFRREIELREPVAGSPLVEVEHGIVRVRLQKTSKAPLPRA